MEVDEPSIRSPSADEMSHAGIVDRTAKTHPEPQVVARADIVAVERAAPADQVAQLVAQSKFTRVPVYDGTVDHVVGIVTSWDVIARPEAPLRSPRPVAFATPDEACHSLMTRMLREKRHLAVVRAATGETLGLVTLEDLVEEFVGEIQDEHDDPVSDR